jgi:hypothetical protein
VISRARAACRKVFRLMSMARSWKEVGAHEIIVEDMLTIQTTNTSVLPVTDTSMLLRGAYQSPNFEVLWN